MKSLEVGDIIITMAKGHGTGTNNRIEERGIIERWEGRGFRLFEQNVNLHPPLRTMYIFRTASAAAAMNYLGFALQLAT